MSQGKGELATTEETERADAAMELEMNDGGGKPATAKERDLLDAAWSGRKAGEAEARHEALRQVLQSRDATMAVKRKVEVWEMELFVCSALC